MKTLIAILVIFFFVNNSSAQNGPEITGKIITEQNNEMLKIKGTVTNNSAIHYNLNYILISVKTGKSGNSSNKQSGKFSIKPNEVKVLSESSIRVSRNDALKMYLFIKDEQTGQLISKDSLEINAKTFTRKVSNVNENEIFELKGLTIDQTKTKTGKDFYDLFYLEYSKLPEKINTAVTIGELPTMGRGSQISVEVDDRTLYSFAANPNDEYLTEQANVCIKIILDYHRKTSLLKNEFRY